jgi:hypothetical protein
MSDDEVRAMGYSHRDERGRWVHKRELVRRERPDDRRARHRATGARRCLSCGVDTYAGDHADHCPDATPSVGAALRDTRDLEAAIAWQPPQHDLPKLSEPERVQLGRLFGALVARRELASGIRPDAPMIGAFRRARKAS